MARFAPSELRVASINPAERKKLDEAPKHTLVKELIAAEPFDNLKALSTSEGAEVSTHGFRARFSLTSNL